MICFGEPPDLTFGSVFRTPRGFALLAACKIKKPMLQVHHTCRAYKVGTDKHNMVCSLRMHHHVSSLHLR